MATDLGQMPVAPSAPSKVERSIDSQLTRARQRVKQVLAAVGATLPGAFKTYVEERYLRTARVQIMARVYGEFYHARGPAAELRNQMLSARTPEESLEGMAWLYGSA